MAISVKLDYRRLADKAARVAANLPREVDQALDEVAQQAVDGLKATQSFEDRTGALRRGFTWRATSRWRRIVYIENSLAGGSSVTPPSRYGMYLELGTRTIAPRRFFTKEWKDTPRRLKAALLRAMARASRG